MLTQHFHGDKPGQVCCLEIKLYEYEHSKDFIQPVVQPVVFIATPIDVLFSNFVNYGRREIGEIVRYLADKKNSPGSPAVATARIPPKICQGQPPKM